MRRTRDTKRQTFMFLSCPTDEDMNRGVADESENNLGLSFPLMMIKASGTHLLNTLMMKRNRQSNGNKWAAHLKASIGNILAIEYKCRNSLSIKTRNIYKREEQLNPKVHTNTHLKITPSQFLSKQLSLFLN